MEFTKLMNEKFSDLFSKYGLYSNGARKNHIQFISKNVAIVFSYSPLEKKSIIFLGEDLISALELTDDLILNVFNISLAFENKEPNEFSNALLAFFENTGAPLLLGNSMYL